MRSWSSTGVGLVVGNHDVVGLDSDKETYKVSHALNKRGNVEVNHFKLMTTVISATQ